MEFLWECMVLSLKVGLGSLCWSFITGTPILIIKFISSMSK